MTDDVNSINLSPIKQVISNSDISCETFLHKAATFSRVYHEKYLFNNGDNGRFISFSIAKDWPKLDDRTYNGRGRLMCNASIVGNSQAIFIY